MWTIYFLAISTLLVHVARSSPYSGTPDIFNCNDLCFAARDGECDDGGPGAVTGLCPYGSDCADCGMRAPYTRRPTVPPTGQVTNLRTSAPVNGGGYQSTTTRAPTSKAPTQKVTKSPTPRPTKAPTTAPTSKPTSPPNLRPTKAPTKKKAKKKKNNKKKKKAKAKQG